MPRKPTRYANHPLVKYVRSLDEEYYLGREVADMLGCSKATLAYLRRHSTTPIGATHKAQYGATVLHLYTPARIAQIAEYMKQVSGVERGLKRRGPPVLWTKSETYRRRRDLDRARTYRNRADGYRAKGIVERAAELEQRAAQLAAELEEARVQRQREVRGTGKK